MKLLTSVAVCVAFGLSGAVGTWGQDDSPKQSTQTDVPEKDASEKHKDAARSQGKPGPLRDRDTWMRAKQIQAQAIFAGLTEGDFKKVEKAASVMYGTGLLEKWLADGEFEQTHVYEGQVNTFEYSLKELARYARQEDIDGALESYIMMSRTCVRCHRMLRDEEKSI